MECWNVNLAVSEGYPRVRHRVQHRQNILGDIGIRQERPMVLMCDNQSCIAIAKNPVFHARTKHIEIQYHFVLETIVSEEV